LTATTLTFLRTDSGFAAALLVQIRLRENEGELQVAEVSWPETVFVSTYAATQSHPPIRFRRFVPIAPGVYRAGVRLEDLGTGKVAERGQVAVVPHLEEGTPALGGILLSRRAPGRAPEPVVSFHIPLGRDTIVAHASVLNLPAGTQIPMLFTIVRFTVDTVRASAPYRFMPTLEVMENRKLFPERTDTVLTRRETRRLGEGGVLLDDALPPLPRGVYQIALRVWRPGQDPTDGSVALALRYFVVVGPAFPRPALLDELVDCTAYLARMNEQRAMDSVAVQPDKRRAFDHFWLSLFPDPTRAASMMRLYFGRIEESNRLFSSFKEGWKTDRGMVYVILGPPERVEKIPDSEVWYYSHPGTYAANVYRFRRVFFAPSNLSIEEFLLRRGTEYETFWERMIMKWREGEVF
jgi:GWxTD domain-containing protein